MLSLQPTVDGSDIQEAKVETVETYCVEIGNRARFARAGRVELRQSNNIMKKVQIRSGNTCL